jgi:hypothetical protein
MSGRLTIADLQRRTDAHPCLHGRWLSPVDAGVFMATSHLDECLTHLVRVVHRDPAKHWRGDTYHMQCGIMLYGTRARIVDPVDEVFACARCVAAAEKFGEPTYRMVPASGCEVSEGKRGWTKDRRKARL